MGPRSTALPGWGRGGSPWRLVTDRGRAIANVDGVGGGGPQALVVVASRERNPRPVEV
jgi:hypothetical protein